ncbi:Fis family transcriptional regulator [Plectonema radiosum NIES-515]|uniref:Fis family transcriptional regulator n=1 Tax=Plectonema radiosum NIES-515 TaxID=2986073 RepID=A0ABT3AZN8_9CYAN|nr:zf-HC2 domain-containing protein [Plectonema radiosum]MCV3214450.1 Fis family transcriptional regulator [Plectonema radiosum NIES-515]
MTTDSQFSARSDLQANFDVQMPGVKQTNESTGAMDMVKRDRFELLSAYLDGEVTAAERKQVEQWLANDASVKLLYARLLKLRQGVRNLTVPQPLQPIEETVQQVMASLRRSSRLAWVCGGTAVAACVISALSGWLPGGDFKMAQKPSIQPTQQTPSSVATSPLMVAINTPVFPIPKTAEASPAHPVNWLVPESAKTEQELN